MRHDARKDSWTTALALSGGVFVSFARVVAYLLISTPDSASFTVTPLTLGPPPGAREAAATAMRPEGLALTMRF